MCVAYYSLMCLYLFRFVLSLRISGHECDAMTGNDQYTSPLPVLSHLDLWLSRTCLCLGGGKTCVVHDGVRRPRMRAQFMHVKELCGARKRSWSRYDPRVFADEVMLFGSSCV